MFIRLKQALLLTAVSVCAVLMSGCLDNSLSAAFSEEFILDAPLGIEANTSSSNSSNSITIRWQSVSGALGYRVYRSTSASGPYSLIGTSSSISSSYTDSNLLAGTTYYYKISACNGVGESSQSSFCYATTMLNTPANVSATSLSSSSISINWSPVSGAAGYRVYRSTSSSGNYTLVGTPSSASYTDNNLSSGTTYYYKVSAYKNNLESSQSYYTSATTILNAPVNVSANSPSPSSITVSWSSVSGAAGYRVYRSTSSSGNYTLVGTPSSASYTDNNLSPGTTYYYKVSAYSNNVESSQSSYTYATTGFDPPASVSASLMSSSGITVSWSSVSGAAEYNVYRSTSYSGSYYKIYTTSYTSYTDNNGLSSGMTYYYKVSASNGMGEESAQSFPPASATTTLNPPTSVSASATSSSSITVSWSQVIGAAGYNVYRSTSASGPYYQVGTSSSTSYTDNNLSPSTTYYYKVSAYNNNNVESSQSSQSASATTALNTPAAPTNVSASLTPSGGITVSWSSVSGAVGYYVYRSTSASGYYSQVGTSYSTSYTNNNLSAGTAYFYKVSAYNSAGEGPLSSYTYETTQLNAPTGVTASPAPSGGIIVNWSSGSGAAGYIVYRGMSVSGPYYQVGTSLFTSYTDDDVVIGVTYYYKVSAYTDYVESLMSLYTSATLLDDEETYDDD
ncbi:N-acetylmuramoyl-L-alanine amidase [Fibrobacteres bacterium R8-0-B4]